jgi:hypothetical protein
LNVTDWSFYGQLGDVLISLFNLQVVFETDFIAIISAFSTHCAKVKHCNGLGNISISHSFSFIFSFLWQDVTGKMKSYGRSTCCFPLINFLIN